MINIANYFLIRYVNLYEKYVLKPVICEVRKFSVICHVEAILEVFPS